MPVNKSEQDAIRELIAGELDSNLTIIRKLANTIVDALHTIVDTLKANSSVPSVDPNAITGAIASVEERLRAQLKPIAENIASIQAEIKTIPKVGGAPSGRDNGNQTGGKQGYIPLRNKKLGLYFAR